MISLKTNISDLILQRTLFDATFGLNSAIERMATGYKVNHAKDNAAGFSIIEDLNTRISSMLQVQNNTENGISLLKTAEGGLEEIADHLNRLRDLAMQASDDIYDSNSRKTLQAEADAIKNEINRIIRNTEFDGQNLYYNSELESVLDTVYSILDQAPSHLAIPNTTETLPKDPNTTASIINKSIAFLPGEEKYIDIGGQSYIVRNFDSTLNTFYCTKDLNTGELTITEHTQFFEIYAEPASSQNIIIKGNSLFLYTGEGSDRICNFGFRNSIHTNGGNDEIAIFNDYVYELDSGRGDDTVIFSINNLNTGNPITFLDPEGNDTYIFESTNAAGLYFRTQDIEGDNTYQINSNDLELGIWDSGTTNSNTIRISGNNNVINSPDHRSLFVLSGSDNIINSNSNSYYAYLPTSSNNTINGGAQLAPGYNNLTGQYFNGDIQGINLTFSPATPTSTATFFFNPLTRSIEIISEGYKVGLSQPINNPLTKEIIISGENNSIIMYGPLNIDLKLNGSQNTIDSHFQQGGNIDITGINNSLTIHRVGAYVDNINIRGQGNQLTTNANSTVHNLNVYDMYNEVYLDQESSIYNSNIYGIENLFHIESNSNNVINIYGDNNYIRELNPGGSNRVCVYSSNNEVILNGSGILDADFCFINGNNNILRIEDTTHDLNINGNNNDVSCGYLSTGYEPINNNTGINVVGYDNSISVDDACANATILGSRNIFHHGSDLLTLEVQGDFNVVFTQGGFNTQANIIGNENTYSDLAGNNAINIVGNNNASKTGEGSDSYRILGNGNLVGGSSPSVNGDIYMIDSGDNNAISDTEGNNILINHGNNTDLSNANIIDATKIDFEMDLKVGIGNINSSIINEKIGFDIFSLNIDFRNTDSARASLSSIDETINKLNEQLVDIGSSIDRLEMIQKEQDVKIQNMISSRSTLRDADIAEVSSDFIKKQILQNASATLLASSRNLRYENVLGLLQNFGK